MTPPEPGGSTPQVHRLVSGIDYPMFIVTVAALVATRLNPSCIPWLIYSHRSAERGHALLLDALGARPVLDLNLRLGEGSGAATALAVLRLACAIHNGMATFEEAAVSGRTSS